MHYSLVAVRQRTGGVSTSDEGVTMQEMGSGPDFHPLYDQIRGLLASRLASGEWRPGEALPSETALARQYGVSQGTMRKALNALAAQRIVDRRQGRGTFVARHDPERSLFQFFRLVDDSDQRQLPDSRALYCRTGRATTRERAALKLPEGTSVTRIHRVRWMDHRPVIVEYITLETRRFPDLHQRSPTELPNTVYAMYQDRYGVSVTRAVEHLRAISASAKDAKLLNVEPGVPLLEVDRIAMDMGNQPVEWRLSRCLTKRHRYLSDLD